MFSEMAEQWIRENLPSIESPSIATETTKGVPSADPQAWSEDFIRWVWERCALREGYDDSSGIGFLLVDFAEWCIAHDAVPARRETFEALLRDAGFPLMDGLACGLVLKVDMEAVMRFLAAPESGMTPARTAVRKETRQ